MRKGTAFSLVGFILGAVGAVVSVTAIVFSAVGVVLNKKFSRRACAEGAIRSPAAGRERALPAFFAVRPAPGQKAV